MLHKGIVKTDVLPSKTCMYDISSSFKFSLRGKNLKTVQVASLYFVCLLVNFIRLLVDGEQDCRSSASLLSEKKTDYCPEGKKTHIFVRPFVNNCVIPHWSVFLIPVGYFCKEFM